MTGCRTGIYSIPIFNCRSLMNWIRWVRASRDLTKFLKNIDIKNDDQAKNKEALTFLKISITKFYEKNYV